MGADAEEDHPASPRLRDAEVARLASCGVEQDVRAGDIVLRPGDPSYDLVVILTGQVQLLSPEGRHDPEVLVAEHGPGGSLGELSLLTGQSVALTARVAEAGRILLISPAGSAG